MWRIKTPTPVSAILKVPAPFLHIQEFSTARLQQLQHEILTVRSLDVWSSSSLGNLLSMFGKPSQFPMAAKVNLYGQNNSCTGCLKGTQQFWWRDLLPFKLPFSTLVLFSSTTLMHFQINSLSLFILFSSNVADFVSLFSNYDKVVW